MRHVEKTMWCQEIKDAELIKADKSAALVVLNYWDSSPQGFATGMCCWPCPDIRGLEPRLLPTPAVSTEPKPEFKILASGLGRGNEASKHPYPASAYTVENTVWCQEKKDVELWTAVSGLLALISRAYCNFSLWHHEFIKAAMVWFWTNEIHHHKALLRLPGAQRLFMVFGLYHRLRPVMHAREQAEKRAKQHQNSILYQWCNWTAY